MTRNRAGTRTNKRLVMKPRGFVSIREGQSKVSLPLRPMGSGLATMGFAVFDLLPTLKDRESLFAESLSTQRSGAGVTLHGRLLPETG